MTQQIRGKLEADLRFLMNSSETSSQTWISKPYRPDLSRPCIVPIFTCSVSAGFPSPADDHIEDRLDLNKLLIKHPAATFFVRVAGDSMVNAGIYPGDLLVVDRSLEPTDGQVVIAIVDGELTVKRLRCSSKILALMPENPKYRPLVIQQETEFEIWGVVTTVIHSP